MARASIVVSAGYSHHDNAGGPTEFQDSAVSAGAQNQANLTADAATMATAMGVLVADGASPTQAHVTTANTAYTALAADITAATKGDLVITWDTTKIATLTHFRAALNQALTAAQGSSILTA